MTLLLHHTTQRAWHVPEAPCLDSQEIKRGWYLLTTQGIQRLDRNENSGSQRADDIHLRSLIANITFSKEHGQMGLIQSRWQYKTDPDHRNRRQQGTGCEHKPVKETW